MAEADRRPLRGARARAWLATVDRDDPALLQVARDLRLLTDEHGLSARVAAAGLLRAVADEFAAEAPKTSLEPVAWRPVGRGDGLQH